ncbi:MAG: hypothetical protein KF770_23060 [Anaerolineae bacterium]|nr:hypothetical protein [Anaerolineae bacterium]
MLPASYTAKEVMFAGEGRQTHGQGTAVGHFPGHRHPPAYQLHHQCPIWFGKLLLIAPFPGAGFLAARYQFQQPHHILFGRINNGQYLSPKQGAHNVPIRQPPDKLHQKCVAYLQV